MEAKHPIPSNDQILALSCSNVGVGPGGTTAMLARVSIVDFKGNVILDTFVAPTMQVTDFRTATTGIEASHLLASDPPLFDRVQQHVAELIKGKVIVGHSLWHDLSVLGIPHPAVTTRDVALYQPFRNALRSPNQVIGLQTLMWHLMGRRCQDGHIHPVENARAALDLYRTVAAEWEGAISLGDWPSCLPPSTFSRCYL
ncbi:ribonuclease H-like domain-containing protein [Melanogaster broomeanus]|nr:ribonuclease H-like domain-containing protein [Melanogaster broomeanus]